MYLVSNKRQWLVYLDRIFAEIKHFSTNPDCYPPSVYFNVYNFIKHPNAICRLQILMKWLCGCTMLYLWWCQRHSVGRHHYIWVHRLHQCNGLFDAMCWFVLGTWVKCQRLSKHIQCNSREAERCRNTWILHGYFMNNGPSEGQHLFMGIWTLYSKIQWENVTLRCS